MSLIVGNKVINITEQGFLTNMNQWTEATATAIACAHSIKLTNEHWAIIHLLRQYCTRHEQPSSMRLFTRLIKKSLGEEQAKSIYLMQLFGSSPAVMAAKLAGLPRPKNCL